MPLRDREARRAYAKAHYAAHREEILAKDRAYNAAHREERHAYAKAHYAAHKAEDNAQSRAYREAHREQIQAQNRAYDAAHREERRAYNRAYRAKNREALLQKQHARYQDNAVRNRRTSQAWRQANPELLQIQGQKKRARKRAAPVNNLTAAQWREIKAAYGHCCVYCKKPQQRLTMDHLTPLSKGGAHTASNIVPACRSCNSRKSIGSPPVPVQPLLLTIAAPRAS
jgi:5-methylcytosine-specific restriction endonuclease McrA